VVHGTKYNIKKGAKNMSIAIKKDVEVYTAIEEFISNIPNSTPDNITVEVGYWKGGKKGEIGLTSDLVIKTFTAREFCKKFFLEENMDSYCPVYGIIISNLEQTEAIAFDSNEDKIFLLNCSDLAKTLYRIFV
jgi:hypothetical protein